MNALGWAEFWAKVLPEVVSAVQALHARFGSDPQKALVEIRKIRDHWSSTDAEDNAFRERIEAAGRRESSGEQLEADRETLEAPEELEAAEPQART